jgi:hypothetical protein
MGLPGAAAVVLPSVKPKSIAMRRSAFVPLVGEVFEIIHDGGTLPVVLRQVSDLKPAVRPGAEDQFSLMFTDARLRPALQGRTYAISHARYGGIALFVAPVDRPETTQCYQAIINSPDRDLIRSHRG